MSKVAVFLSISAQPHVVFVPPNSEYCVKEKRKTAWEILMAFDCSGPAYVEHRPLLFVKQLSSAEAKKICAL